MIWYIEKKTPGRYKDGKPRWRRVESFTDQHSAEQRYFRYHYGIGRVSNEDGTVLIFVPTGEEKEN